MKTVKRVLFGLFALLLLASLGFVFWALAAYPAGESALGALQSNSAVAVTQDGSITFAPGGPQPKTGLIFYPGGRVDPRAYAPALRQVAERGYLVVLVRAPLNLMVFDPDKAGEVIAKHPDIEHWAVGGHSLGGAMAANFAYTHPGAVEGLALWASYPAGSNDLSDSGLQVLSVYGTLDMAGMEPFKSSASLLPGDTTWVVIEGGNHAQFGDYGPQAGDNPAGIPAQVQWKMAAESTVRLLAIIEGR